MNRPHLLIIGGYINSVPPHALLYDWHVGRRLQSDACSVRTIGERKNGSTEQ